MELSSTVYLPSRFSFLTCRCGRAGRPGIVVNLATPETKFVFGKFASQAKVTFDDCEVKGGQLWAVSRVDPSLPPPSAEGERLVSKSVSPEKFVSSESTVTPEAAVVDGGGVGDAEDDSPEAMEKESTTADAILRLPVGNASSFLKRERRKGATVVSDTSADTVIVEGGGKDVTSPENSEQVLREDEGEKGDWQDDDDDDDNDRVDGMRTSGVRLETDSSYQAEDGGDEFFPEAEGMEFELEEAIEGGNGQYENIETKTTVAAPVMNTQSKPQEGLVDMARMAALGAGGSVGSTKGVPVPGGMSFTVIEEVKEGEGEGEYGEWGDYEWKDDWGDGDWGDGDWGEDEDGDWEEEQEEGWEEGDGGEGEKEANNKDGDR